MNACGSIKGGHRFGHNTVKFFLLITLYHGYTNKITQSLLAKENALFIVPTVCHKLSHNVLSRADQYNNYLKPCLLVCKFVVVIAYIHVVWAK